MSSQRVSRGFHRLAVFLAAIPLLVGVTLSLFYAGEPTYKDLQRHKFLVCARGIPLQLGWAPASS